LTNFFNLHKAKNLPLSIRQDQRPHPGQHHPNIATLGISTKALIASMAMLPWRLAKQIQIHVSHDEEPADKTDLLIVNALGVN
jgi:hypothetical protein